jgi:hypothetical protein
MPPRAKRRQRSSAPRVSLFIPWNWTSIGRKPEWVARAGNGFFQGHQSARAGGYWPREDCRYGYGRYPYAGAFSSRTGG